MHYTESVEELSQIRFGPLVLSEHLRTRYTLTELLRSPELPDES